MRETGRRPLGAALIVLMLFAFAGLVPAAANHEGDGTQHDFDNAHFEVRWERTDLPVATGQVSRTWMWGYGPYSVGDLEPYQEAPGGMRQIQYFDKSRMEINHDPAIDEEDIWHVTNGLLVVEMVEGRFQIGDSTFDDSALPSTERIAGDPNGLTGPTYADIDELGLRERPAMLPGTTITLTITEDGSIIGNPEYTQHGVTAEYRLTVEGIDHTVASVFWDFMTAQGLVWDGDSYVVDDLFINPFYATGYPITGAFWSEITVAGEQRDVLWQCFERRCLTYTPGNDPGWEVEAGNVGQHYFRWRYGDEAPETETVSLYLVDRGGATPASTSFGCDDLLVPVQAQIVQHDTLPQRVTAALTRLFAYKHATLYNAFQNSTVAVQSVTMAGTTATINITGSFNIGDACDEPRVEEQIAATAAQFPGVNAVVIKHNGGPLFPPPGPLDGGILATFSVSGQQYRIWVTNEETIDAILELQAGGDIGNIPNGLIHHGPGQDNHNAPWSWHIDPEEIVMAEVTMEMCDGTPAHVEDNVDYFVDTVKRYCPWSATLVGVVDYR
ncbi:MAG TPA: GerMN domain-containing protein [Thermomicrobiales bacterium]|nr:GerMN domain-containing protein [Thermomicrobiales bacterium]